MKCSKRWRLSVLIMFIAIVAGCKDSSVNNVVAPVIDDSNRPPRVNHSVDYSWGTSRAPFHLSDRSVDPERRPLDVTWVTSDGTFHGREVSVSFPEPGVHSVTQIVTDGENTVSENFSLRVLSSVHLRLTIVSITFGNDVGDGVNNAGRPYIIGTAVASNGNSISSYISRFPRNAPDQILPPLAYPNTTILFDPNSGVVLYDSIVTDILGFSLLIVDHDPAGFDWFGFFGDLFGAIGGMVAVFEPTTGSIISGLGEISSLVGNAIGSTADDVISVFEKLHGPVDRWSIGTIQTAYGQQGMSMRYRIEFVP